MPASRSSREPDYGKGDGVDEYGQGGSSRDCDHQERDGDSGSDDVCCLCLETMDKIAAPRCRECLKAMGHPDCVVPWLLSCDRTNTCPLCRAQDPMTLSDARDEEAFLPLRMVMATPARSGGTDE